jgi:multidrug efflux pump
MNLAGPFIRRPVGTALLTIAIALAGALGYLLLPVSPLPQIEFPTISVQAALPGASPETMASAVATPLERQFGRIAGITEMTSTSFLGSTSITMQFDLARDIDGAARDVQAAINAARSQLPSYLPGNPTYRKVNPADAPIIILSLTSQVYGKARMYDAASSILAQKLSQVQGVGQVNVGGGALPAVRVDVNPTALGNLGLGLADVRTTLAAANVNRPKGFIGDGDSTWALATTDQLQTANEYRPLVIAYRAGAAVRVGDVAVVSDGVEDVRTTGLADGKPAVLMIISRQPGANIIQTVDRVRALIPELQAEIPAGIDLGVVMDRTTTIRASVHDVQVTLLISLLLVVLVVFAFLRDWRATFIPAVAVPVSIVGTFGVMWLLGYTIDNLSLMALTIATGFVVDDAIVVIENITRHLEAGMRPRAAALRGAKEIGFTVLSISVSLVAVFIPLLLMSGLVGRLFREFAVTLSVAVGISMVISLTTTPMLCAVLLKHKDDERRGRLFNASERVFTWVLGVYRRSLTWALDHHWIMLAVTLATIVVTMNLYGLVPKGFFPQQDTGRLTGSIRADQSTSSQAMAGLVARLAKVVSEDAAVENVIAFTGGGRSTANTGNCFITLKDVRVRRMTADEVIARLRPKLAAIPGVTLFLQPVQDLRIGGRASNAQYQFTLQGDDLAELSTWSVRLTEALRGAAGFADVNSDQQNNGLQADLAIDRPTAARLGITPAAIDSALYDAFGQRQVSTMYRQLNQYHVIMEMTPALWQDPSGLDHLRVAGSGGAQVPLTVFAHQGFDTHNLAVNHQGQFPSVTISFNLAPGLALSDAVKSVQDTVRDIGMPVTLTTTFSGTAQAFQDSARSTLYLLAAAIVAVYIVLGMLYESLVHPITIISTLPSAGLGALLALLVTGTDLSLIAFIGIILLIGIVKKNAIMMIDFALQAEQHDGLTPREAIFKACLLRFRPIMMTTTAALFGGLPLAFGSGTGAELRRPLGIAIVGGLLVSQVLTLYTTPVVFLLLDWLRTWVRRKLGRKVAAPVAERAVIVATGG